MTKYNYNLNVLTNEDSLSYYILGVFMSDGFIKHAGKNTYSSSLGSKDKEWLESIKNKFDPNIKVDNPALSHLRKYINKKNDTTIFKE